jgi:hypothetical protein
MKDIIFSTLLFKITNDIKTQTFSDILGLIVILIFTVFITNKNILNYIYDKSDSLIKYYNNYNYITFKCEEHKSSLRFKAIMYFINKNNNKTITSVLEGPNMKWSNKIHDMVEDKNNVLDRRKKIENVM